MASVISSFIGRIAKPREVRGEPGGWSRVESLDLRLSRFFSEEPSATFWSTTSGAHCVIHFEQVLQIESFNPIKLLRKNFACNDL